MYITALTINNQHWLQNSKSDGVLFLERFFLLCSESGGFILVIRLSGIAAHLVFIYLSGNLRQLFYTSHEYFYRYQIPHILEE